MSAAVDVPSPSPWAAAMLGHRITWKQTVPKQRTVEGICIKVERVLGALMQTDEGTFPCVRFRIKTDDGHRYWTGTFADKGTDEMAAS